MRISEADVAWLTEQLEQSSDASVKLFYLSLGARRENAEANAATHDPMNLLSVGTWTLEKLLWACRLVACDERTLWECLGPEFITAFSGRIHSWNEQQAVKHAHYFLSHKRSEMLTTDTCGSSGGEAEEELRAMEQSLAHYAAGSIKPQGGQRVDGGAVDAVEGAPPEVIGNARVVPMREGDAYSEGSLVCSGAVPAFGELLRVPRAQMFYVGTVVQHSALGRVIAADTRLHSLLENEEALLVLCFAYEYFVVGPERSHWAPLLRRCPPAYPTVPAFSDLASLAELSGLDIVDEVIARREQTAAFCEDVQPALSIMHEGLEAMGGGEASSEGPRVVPDLAAFEAVFTPERITFVKATFDSRAFNLRVDDADVLALVPWADMINHQNRTDVLIRRVEADDGDFVMLAGAALTAAEDMGRELWMSYGPLQNWELLQYYGFALPENEYDQLPFPLALEETETEAETEGGRWAARRQALVARYSLLSVGRCWVGRSGRPCDALRALMRIHMAQAEEFPVMEGSAFGPFQTLSKATELQVVAAIAATADAVLEQFPTTLNEDAEILRELDAEDAEDAEDGEDPHTSDNLRLALRVRMGIKEIAQRLHLWCAKEEEQLMATADTTPPDE